MKANYLRLAQLGIFLIGLLISKAYAQDGELLNAIKNNDMKTINELLKKGTDINTKFQNGFTPLMVAVINGHEQIIKYLIANGAKINEKANSGVTAIALADNRDIYDMLMDAGADTIGSSYKIRFLTYSGENTNRINPVVQFQEIVHKEKDGSVVQVLDYLKKVLKDPESLKIAEWGEVTKLINMPDKSFNGCFRIRVKYRAKNSYGGYGYADQIFILDKSTGECVGNLDYSIE